MSLTIVDARLQRATAAKPLRAAEDARKELQKIRRPRHHNLQFTTYKELGGRKDGMITPVAITFDWYGTLADHRLGVGRGRQFRDYLASQGLSGDPWDRRVLYEVFDYYAGAYRPELSDSEQRSVWIEFTRLLFKSSKVSCPPDQIAVHAHAISEIFGSNCFRLFAEVKETLSALKTKGLRLGLISNWQRGLNCFCEELGIAPYFDVIISSADVGYEKPDPRIFGEALTRLRTLPEETLHVGDSIDDDVGGAKAAGLDALLVDRRGLHAGFSGRRVSDLHELRRRILL